MSKLKKNPQPRKILKNLHKFKINLLKICVNVFLRKQGYKIRPQMSFYLPT